MSMHEYTRRCNPCTVIEVPTHIHKIDLHTLHTCFTHRYGVRVLCDTVKEYNDCTTLTCIVVISGNMGYQ